MNDTLTLSAQDRCFSDLHKDAYGFRPGPDRWALWNSMTPEQLDAEEAYLYRAIQFAIKEEAEAEQLATAQFEAYLAKMQSDYNIDRATAIRWDKESIGEDIALYGESLYCYHHGLPYNYFNV